MHALIGRQVRHKIRRHPPVIAGRLRDRTRGERRLSRTTLRRAYRLASASATWTVSSALIGLPALSRRMRRSDARVPRRGLLMAVGSCRSEMICFRSDVRRPGFAACISTGVHAVAFCRVFILISRAQKISNGIIFYESLLFTKIKIKLVALIFFFFRNIFEN